MVYILVGSTVPNIFIPVCTGWDAAVLIENSSEPDKHHHRPKVQIRDHKDLPPKGNEILPKVRD